MSRSTSPCPHGHGTGREAHVEPRVQVRAAFQHEVSSLAGRPLNGVRDELSQVFHTNCALVACRDTQDNSVGGDGRIHRPHRYEDTRVHKGLPPG
jgi:hypothetical protein